MTITLECKLTLAWWVKHYLRFQMLKLRLGFRYDADRVGDVVASGIRLVLVREANSA